jgi:hypothetical protein
MGIQSIQMFTSILLLPATRVVKYLRWTASEHIVLRIHDAAPGNEIISKQHPSS